MIPQTWFSFSEACEYLRLSRTTLKKLVAERSITFSKPTGKLLFKREWLDQFVEAGKSEGVAEIVERIWKGVALPAPQPCEPGPHTSKIGRVRREFSPVERT